MQVLANRQGEQMPPELNKFLLPTLTTYESVYGPILNVNVDPRRLYPPSPYLRGSTPMPGTPGFSPHASPGSTFASLRSIVDAVRTPEHQNRSPHATLSSLRVHGRPGSTGLEEPPSLTMDCYADSGTGGFGNTRGSLMREDDSLKGRASESTRTHAEQLAMLEMATAKAKDRLEKARSAARNHPPTRTLTVIQQEPMDTILE